MAAETLKSASENLASFPIPERPPRVFVPESRSIELLGNPDVTLELEVYKGSGGHGAIGGHFGKVFEHEALWQAVYQAGHRIPEGKEPPGTGFDRLIKWPIGTTLEEQSAYTMEAAQHALTALLDVNEMEPDAINAIFLACGVPITDRTEKRGRFVDIIAEDGKLTNASRFEANLACNSWVYLVDKALSDPEYLAKRVAILAVEPTASLTPDLSPERADLFSTIAFSNTLSGVILEPWIDSAKYESSYYEQQDTKNLLAERMYEEELDPTDPRLVQIRNGRAMVVGTPPDDGKWLQMSPIGTTRQFIKIGSEFSRNLIQEHQNNYPAEIMRDVMGEHYVEEGEAAYHFASEGVTSGIEKSLARSGIIVHFPRKISEGNGSAAQTGLMFARTLEDRDPYETFMLVSFGAGTSSSGMYLQLLPRR